MSRVNELAAKYFGCEEAEVEAMYARDRARRVDRVLAALLPEPLEAYPPAVLEGGRKAINEYMDRHQAEIERLILYGDPQAREPVGILHASESAR